MEKELDIIEMTWSGPHSPEEVIRDMHGDHDYGVYQIYGTHNIMGSDCLLYIGKSQERSFSERFQEHSDDWFEWESAPLSVYLGRIGSSIKIMKEEDHTIWGEQIDRAEKLLIFFCSPPYNSIGIKTLPDMQPTLLLNFRQKHRIPMELSTYLWTATIDSPSWKVYGQEDDNS